eukprot:12795_6
MPLNNTMLTNCLTVLADALENAFKGTAGDGVIQSLFEGEMNDYLRCTVCN